jgi:hypothetical protein
MQSCFDASFCDLVGPAGAGEAVGEVVEDRLGNVDGEGLISWWLMLTELKTEKRDAIQHLCNLSQRLLVSEVSGFGIKPYDAICFLKETTRS